LRPWITATFSPPAAASATFLHPWRAGDRQARSEAESLLTALPAGVLLVTSRDLAGPLRYLEEVEDRPSEVTVFAAPADLDTLLNLHLGQRAIAFAGLDSAGLDSVRRRVRLVPHGPYFLAEPRPAALDLADERFREGRWWEAAYHYGAVLGSGGTADQAYPDALARWAVALERSGFPELAAAVTARYVAVTRDLVAAHQTLGDLYIAAGARESAATHFAAARAALFPGQEAAKAFLEGRIAEARGDPNAARSSYLRCLELNPGHRQARERLALLGGGG
jgi:tetratricopeptide (TPR) repeat protein